MDVRAAVQSVRMVKLSRMLKLLKMMKLMRLMKMPQLISRLEVHFNRGLLGITKFIAFICVIDHLMV
jgi:hypothetical protein